MKAAFVSVMMAVALAGSPAPAVSDATTGCGDPVEIALKRAVTGGVVLHVGFSTADLALRLTSKGRFLIHMITRDPKRADEARGVLQKAGAYGRVSVYVLREDVLPHADDLAKIVIVEDPLGLPRTECERVLAPTGLYMQRQDETWSVEEEPIPADMAERPAAGHIQGANAMASADDRVGLPTDVRWLAAPDSAWVEAMVAADGRLFQVRPARNNAAMWLEARCAFSGMLLWSRELAKGRKREGAPIWAYDYPLAGWGNLGKREITLVAADKRVFCFGQAFDAVTGAPRYVFEGMPLLCAKDVLLVSRRGGKESAMSALDARTGETLWGQPGAAGTLAGENEGMPPLGAKDVLLASRGGGEESAVSALDARTGKTLWSRPGSAGALAGENVVLVAGAAGGKRLSAWSLKMGAPVWTTELAPIWAQLPDSDAGKDSPSASYLASVGTSLGLVALRGQETLLVFSPTTGAFIRAIEARVARPGTFMPADIGRNLGLTRDVVWFLTKESEVIRTCAPGGKWESAPADPAGSMVKIERAGHVLSAVDLFTGQVMKRLASPGMEWRCYQPVLTAHWAYLAACSVLNLRDGNHFQRPFYRNACKMGYVPAYGLLYIPPTSNCGCYPKLNWLLAVESDKPRSAAADGAGGPEELVKGPAYEEVQKGPPLSELAAPVCDMDPPPSSKLLWETPITHLKYDVPEDIQWLLPMGQAKPEGPLQILPINQIGYVSAARVHGDRALLSVTEEHRVLMVDIREGKVIWDFTADARVSLRPLWFNNLCVFGCRNGWVYAIRPSDGALVWRRRLAPRTKWIVAFDQFESSWPVAGEMLLLHEGKVYANVGRHCGTVETGSMACVDLRSGALVWRNRFPLVEHIERERTARVREPWFEHDGRTVSLGHMRFDLSTGAPVNAETAKRPTPRRLSMDDLIRGTERAGAKRPEADAGTQTPAPATPTVDLILRVTREGVLQRYARP